MVVEENKNKSKPKDVKGNGNKDMKADLTEDPKKEGKKNKSFSYSAEPIHRFQIFFASSMNRAPGIFSKSIICYN